MVISRTSLAIMNFKYQNQNHLKHRAVTKTLVKERERGVILQGSVQAYSCHLANHKRDRVSPGNHYPIKSIDLKMRLMWSTGVKDSILINREKKNRNTLIKMINMISKEKSFLFYV